MTARRVLRKKIRFSDQLLDFLIDRNKQYPDVMLLDDDEREKISDVLLKQAILEPRYVELGKGDDSKAQESPTLVPETGIARALGDGTAYLNTWGLALREEPRKPLAKGGTDNGTRWIPNYSPDDLRPRLLQRPDVLTEIAEDNEGVGDLPTQPDFSDAERLSVSVDIKMEVAGYINSGQNSDMRLAGSATFGTARDAMRLIGANWAATSPFVSKDEELGEDINVVIVDTGLSEDYMRKIVPDVAFAGGMVDRVPERPDPGEYKSPFNSAQMGHGNMIARNILRIAPRARIFDAPLLPPRVTDVEAFTDHLELLYQSIEDTRADSDYADQKWIIVNAWAVADSVQEKMFGLPLSMLYTTGQFHGANTTIQSMSEDFAIIFAAGNNGQFPPAPGAGPYNVGPHRAGGPPAYEAGRPHGSISGANALPGVLTVGACNVLGQWIGASSQGDAPRSLQVMAAHPPDSGKPDLVAPSWFCEDNDRHQLNTGTSAACAVTAGLAAALWSSSQAALSPQELFQHLRDTTSGTVESAPTYRERMGAGVVHA